MPLPARFRSLSPARRIVALLALAVFTLYGGGKGELRIENGELRIENAGVSRVLRVPRPEPQPRAGPGGAASSNEVFRWTAFSIDGDRFDGMLEWPATNLADFAAIDIFHKGSLTNAAWRWIHRKDVSWPEDLTTSVTFYGDELPYREEATSWTPYEATNEVMAPFGVIYTNVIAYVTNAAGPSSGFFRAASQHDTDDDGAPDAIEASLGLDPDDPDMDGDGVPDGRELALGASPFLVDSDGDGLDDGAEVSWGAAATNGATLWIDMSSLTNRVILFADVDDDCAGLAIPFPLHLAGAAMTNLAVNANGLVGFSSAEAAFGSGCHSNGDASDIPLASSRSATVAAFWDDLVISPDVDASVSFATIGADGCRAGVVEFAHAGFYGESTNDLVSFQVQFREAETNVVRVVFSEASGLGCGESATLGARPTHDEGVEYAYNEDGAVFPGLAIEYHFGLGTNPAKADTDDDGLDDSEELALGTDPLDEDTDGDGCPDGWEVQYGFNPLDAASPAPDLDSDGDGLPDAEESRLGTNHLNSDTDGDGLSDGDEHGYVFATMQTPFDMAGATNVLELFPNLGNGKISIELPFPIQPGVARECARIVAGIDGRLALATGTGTSLPSSPSSTRPMVIRAFDDNLQACTNELGSAMSIATSGTNGVRRFVIEYRAFGFYGLDAVETNSVSFQVAFVEDEPDVVRVRYFRADGGTNELSRRALGDYAELGARTARCTLDYSTDAPVAHPGLALEYHFGTGSSPLLADTDGDGLDDGEECAHGADPLVADTDGDGVIDGEEVLAGTSPTLSDTDCDGLDDWEERSLGTNPLNADSDGDGIPDGWEVQHHLNPLLDDTLLDFDGDGLSNADEYHLGTGIDAPDTDSDGLMDGAEVVLGTDPLQPDTDGDGMPDGWENGYRLNPLNPADGSADSDGDGLSNVEEYFNASNPGNSDSDGDGVNDGVEVSNGTDPNNPNDGVNPPAADEFLTLPFHIYGDYAAWEMMVVATTNDTRTFRLVTNVPAQSNTRCLKLRKGASYEISMRWRGDGDHNDHEWYCWEAQFGDPLSPNSRCFNDYNSTRLSGNEILVGDGWICENADGLLTSHVHTHDGRGDNIAKGKKATLHILKIEHELLFETANPCNRIFNSTPKDDSTGNTATVMETESGCTWAIPRNNLYVVETASSGTFNATELMSIRPAEAAKHVVCAAFSAGTLVAGSETTVMSSGEAIMHIPAPQDANTVEYELRAAVVTNGVIGQYADTYPLEVYRYNGVQRNATVKGISGAKYEEHRQNIHSKVFISGDNPPNLVAPHARSFLKLFFDPDGGPGGLAYSLRPSSSSDTVINAFSDDASCSAEWLTHNSGANFTFSGVASIKLFFWNSNTQVSQFMSQRTPFSLKESTVVGGIYNESATETGTRLKQFYNTNVKAEAESLLLNATNGTEVTMPLGGNWYEQDTLTSNGVFTSLSPTWVPGLTLCVGSSSNYGGYEALFSQYVLGSSAFDDFDAFGTIGRGRILNPRYRFTVKKNEHVFGPDSFDVVRVDFECAIEDLYDFNYEDGDLPAHAAALQIGYGNGSIPGYSSRGRIYRHRIDISSTYNNPFDYENIIIQE